MKILVVAHPDDEIIWFNPKGFDKIVICFCDRKDKPEFYDKRLQALYLHPLKEKIVNLQLVESKFWEDEEQGRKKLEEELLKHTETAKIIYTHNEVGEYGHIDHILVHNVITKISRCPVFCLVKDDEKGNCSEKPNYSLIESIIRTYKSHGVWTWYKDWCPPESYIYKKVK